MSRQFFPFYLPRNTHQQQFRDGHELLLRLAAWNLWLWLTHWNADRNHWHSHVKVCPALHIQLAQIDCSASTVVRHVGSGGCHDSGWKLRTLLRSDPFLITKPSKKCQKRRITLSSRRLHNLQTKLETSYWGNQGLPPATAAGSGLISAPVAGALS